MYMKYLGGVNMDDKEKNTVFGKYGTIIISALTVIITSIIFFFVIFEFNSIIKLINILIDMLQPIILGMVFAYLINPLVNFFEKKLMCFFVEKIKMNNSNKLRNVLRNVSISFSMIIILLFIGVLLMAVLPELAKSVKGLVAEFPIYISNCQNIIENQINGNAFIGQIIEESAVYLQDFLNETVVPNLKMGIEKAAFFVIDFLVLLKNLIIGIIVAFYTLNTKGKFKTHAKKIIFAFFNKEKAINCIEIIKHVDRIFGGYIIGQLTDAVIVGAITFLFVLIADIPYGLLISVVVGATNVIPFFGPFIGAIPSAFIIFLVDPIKAVIFVIFILIMQQIDGNIICPNILGDKTGLSPFWVLFAILLGGGVFGFLGMVLGVPTFAVFYYLFSKFINTKLEKKGIEIKELE